MPADPEEFSSNTLVFEGEPLKALNEEGGKVTVGAYAVRFSDASEPDLTGDYFTKSTDFGPNCGNGVAAMFNHGLPLAKGVKALDEVADMTFGPIKTTKDDVGIFVQHTLDTSDKYQKAIADLCAKGKLKWSSGTASHMMRKSKDGQIKRWHIAEVSYTPKPAEPRLPTIAPLKSIDAGLASEIAKAFGVDTPQEPEPAQSAPPTKSTIKVMPALTAEQEAENKKTLLEAEHKEMRAVGAHFKCAEVAEDFIFLGKSLEDLRVHVAENVVKARPVITDPKLGMDKKDRKEWKFLKAVREIAAAGFNPNALSGVERAASDETAKLLKMTPRGFFIPHDIVMSSMAEDNDLGALAVKALIEQANSVKTLNHTSFASGGALVGTQLLTGSMIELLRNKPLVSQMGARTLTGLVGNVAIPRLNGGATTYWVSESGNITSSDASFGQLGLTPKKLAARTGYTKELLSQTDMSVEALCRDDLTTVLGLAKDLAALNGTGGAQPLGIINQPTGLNSSTFGGTATRFKAIDFQKQVAIDNASRGALAYLTTPNVSATWMGIPEVPNYPTWLWQGNIDQGTVVGRPAYSTNQVPNDKVIYGNWNDLILADWAGIDVVVNPYTNDATGVITITIFLLTDVGVRQVVSFCVSTDSGAQ